MSNAILDLDVLRPPRRIVKLGGKEIDVSYVPVGITFEIDDINQEIAKLDVEKLSAGGEEVRKAFDLTVRLCVAFCQWRHPEMDEAWFRGNVDAQQIRLLAEEIREALVRAYKGIDPKNAGAAQES
jgi:hypothetical protein